MSNFNDYNNYENLEKEIRPPDNPIKEILVNNYDYNNYIEPYIHNESYINSDYDDYNNELQLAINESIKEQEEVEKKQLEILEKTRIRFESFKNVLLKIKKISMFDPKIMKFYNIIESIIDSYCACNIDIYDCDKAMYDEIFGTLKTIRINESELELFKNLFIIEK
jgi:hypothetical protein